MKPLLSKEPIEAWIGAKNGPISGFVMFAYVLPDGELVFHFWQLGLKLCGPKSIFINPSPTLLAFIAEAEAHFKPLVEIPITKEQFLNIAFRTDCNMDRDTDRFRNLLASYGFKCKEAA